MSVFKNLSRNIPNLAHRNGFSRIGPEPVQYFLAVNDALQCRVTYYRTTLLVEHAANLLHLITSKNRGAVVEWFRLNQSSTDTVLLLSAEDREPTCFFLVANMLLAVCVTDEITFSSQLHSEMIVNKIRKFQK